MTAPGSILVLGAGELGIEVLKSLTSHPARKNAIVSALTRSQNPTIDGLGVRSLRGDVVAMSEEQLADTFAKCEVVISCNGMTLPPETQMKLAKAAIRAGVKRYFPWQFGLSYDDIGRQSSQNLFDAQLDVRDLLRSQSSMSWVIVSTGVFTSFLFEPSFGVVDLDRGVVTALGSWDNRVTATSPADIGRVVAELVFASPEVEGIVYTAGDALSMLQLADTVDRILNAKLQRRVATVAELELELKNDPEDSAKKYRAVFAAGAGIAWEVATTYNFAHAMPMQTVEQWALEHIASLYQVASGDDLF